jgi:hypothetical protein
MRAKFALFLSFWVRCILLACIYAANTSVQIPLRSNSSIYADLDRIEHDFTNREVTVTLKATRRCPSPTFILRLSGTALYKLELTSRTDGVVKYQYPPLIDAGDYSLDAIVLYCETFNPNNVTQICIEKPHYRKNVIIEPYSFNVAAGEVSASTVATSRWKNNAAAATFVSTRYQKLAEESDGSIPCENLYAGIYCAPNPAELMAYNAYKWVDQPLWLPIAQEVHTRVSARTRHQKGQTSSLRFNICFIGDSHSRELTFNGWDHPDAVGYITFTFVMNLFPTLLDLTQLATHECSIAVISYGQWPLSQFAPTPFRADEFQAQLSVVGTKISDYQGPIKIFYRSENFNGLSAHGGACPSKDHRVVPAIERVNALAQEMCAKFRIPFIDLHAVIAPMWDAALDYSHPNHPVFRAEVDIILHVVFSALRKEAVPMVPLAAVKKVHETSAKTTFFERSRVQMRWAQSHYVYNTAPVA